MPGDRLQPTVYPISEGWEPTSFDRSFSDLLGVGG